MSDRKKKIDPLTKLV